MSQHEIIGGRVAQRRRGARRDNDRPANEQHRGDGRFDRCRSRIDELLDAHVPMGFVERMIDAYALDREEKDALWLWASARRDQLLNGASESDHRQHGPCPSR